MISKSKILGSIVLAAALTGCGVTIVQPEPEPEVKGAPVGGTIHTDTFVQGDLVGGYADILFVVDNSGSMADDQARLAASFDTFINWIVTKNVDFHIAITTTDMGDDGFGGGQKGAFQGTPSVLQNTTPNLIDTFKANVLVGDMGSGTEKGYSPAIAALTEPLASTVNAGFLRENAKLYVVFVSDEEEQSLVTTADFMAQMTALKGGNADKVFYTAITAETGNACGADAGLRYQELIAASGDLFGSICQTDFGTTLQNLGFEVTSASGEYFLTATPEPSTIEVKVDGVLQTADRWTYHANTNSVELLAGFVPMPGATIVIKYEIFGTASTCLENGEVVYDLDGGEYSWKFYCVDVPAGTSKLLVHLWNGRGDADLYLKIGADPGEAAYDFRAVTEGLDETLLLENPAAGSYHIGIYGFHRYEDVNMQPIYIGNGAGGGGTGLDEHLVVSQVSYDTAGTDAVEEYVEINNPTTATVSLTGWTIADNSATWTFPAGTTIAAGQTLSIARDAAGFTALYGKAPSITGLTVNLSNSGDWIMLNDAAGTSVDFVAWEGASSGWTIASPTGSSIERADNKMDTDRESDWVVRSPAAPRG